jgi:oligopeptide transport system substrate-binding protein
MRVLPVILLSLFSALLLSCDRRSNVAIATEENILVIGNSNEPKGLDPHLVSGVLESNLIRALFEGLCVDNPSKDGVADKGVAKDWKHSEDYRVWTFYLNEKAKWSDGEPVTAHDFVFSYQRMLNPRLPSKYADMLYFIKGAEDYNKEKNPDPGSIGAKAIDDRTLELTLRGPIPFLPEITKHYTWYPVPRHIILKFSEGDPATPFTGWTKPGNIVSNGPFQLKDWKIKHYIEVERNPHYWDAGEVQLDGIRFLPISNSYTETRMFLDEQLHMTYTVPPEMIPYAKEHVPAMLRQEDYIGTRYLRINTRRQYLDNVKVRHALACAIDRAQICKSVRGGNEKPASGVVPPFAGYTVPPGASFDPERGRQLLAEAGFPNGEGLPEFKFLTTDRDVSRRMAEAYMAMWREHLNINVRIQQREWTTYLQDQYDGAYDLAGAGWIGDFLYPTTFLDMWTKDNGNNNTGWHSEDYEAKLKESENSIVPEEKLQLLQDAEKIFLADMPIIPVFWYTTNYLIRPEVEGWHPLQLNNHPYKNVSLKRN